MTHHPSNPAATTPAPTPVLNYSPPQPPSRLRYVLRRVLVLAGTLLLLLAFVVLLGGMLEKRARTHFIPPRDIYRILGFWFSILFFAPTILFIVLTVRSSLRTYTRPAFLGALAVAVGGAVLFAAILYDWRSNNDWENAAYRIAQLGISAAFTLCGAWLAFVFWELQRHPDARS